MQVQLPNGQLAAREIVHHKGAAAVVPVDADGKLDPTRIASPEDFANWDDLGCQG